MIPAVTTAIPLPEPLPLPAPVWLLWGLLLLTSFLHLVAMNLLAGGAVIAAHARARHGATAYGREVVAIYTRAMPTLIAATVTLGVAPLLFLQVLYGRLFFVSSILMAWTWLAIVPAVMAVYFAAYWLAARARRRLPASGPIVYLVLAGALLAIAFVLSTNMTLMLRPERFAALYATGAAGMHLNLDDPTIWPRWLHMMLGAIAVAGLVLVGVGLVRRPTQPEFATWAQRYGARWAAFATAVNVLIGAWWIAALPTPVLQAFLGGQVGQSLLLAAAIALGVTALPLIAALSRPGAPALIAGVAGGVLAAALVTMLLVRDHVRTAAIAAGGFVPQTAVAPQWGNIGLFAVLLVTAIATVVWMTGVLLRPNPQEIRRSGG
jgi:hypothetical protein